MNTFNCSLPLEKSVGEVFQGVHSCAFLKLTSPALCLFWGPARGPRFRSRPKPAREHPTATEVSRTKHSHCLCSPDRPRQIFLSNVTYWSTSIDTTRRPRDRRAGDCCHRSARPIRSTLSPHQARIGMASLEIDELPVRPQSQKWAQAKQF